MKTPRLIAAMALLALSGCHGRSAAVPIRAVASPGIVLSQARLVLPAVKGNPGAAYFTLRNNTEKPVTLIRIDIILKGRRQPDSGAHSTQMHETSGGTMQPLPEVRIAAGQQISFAPAGKHVMVFGLAAVVPGARGGIVANFAGGKTSAAPLRIEAAGGADAMAGMDMTGDH